MSLLAEFKTVMKSFILVGVIAGLHVGCSGRVLVAVHFVVSDRGVTHVEVVFLLVVVILAVHKLFDVELVLHKLQPTQSNLIRASNI